MRQIDYVDAPAGAGKTYSAAGWIEQQIACGGKVILAQPITRLIAETVDATFPAHGIDASFVTEITERTHPNGGIVKAIVQHINEAPEGRGVSCPTRSDRRSREPRPAALRPLRAREHAVAGARTDGRGQAHSSSPMLAIGGFVISNRM